MELVGVCPITGVRDVLVEAITNEGIKIMSKKYALENNLIIVRRPSDDQLGKATSSSDFHSRFYKEKPFEAGSYSSKKREASAVDKELSGIVKNSIKEKSYDDLIDNFHWHIQQSRRRSKLSVKQLSEAIAEPEVIIEMAEKGKLPENYLKIVNKFEQYFGIKLKKEDDRITGIEKGEFNVNKADWNQVTIGDLKVLKEVREAREKALKEVEEDTKKRMMEKKDPSKALSGDDIEILDIDEE